MLHATQPIVSVVIPMFNVGQYIEKCIESVLAQTFKHFEVVCVDDECTDDTLHRLARFNDPRIRLVQQKNRGLSGARNTGIQHARGIYVALLDADDFWAPDKLAKHVSHLNSNPEVGVSYCPSVFVDEENNELGIGQYPQLSDIDAATVMCRNPVGNGSAPVIRKQVLLKMNLNGSTDARIQVFSEQLRQSEDIELWLRIALNTQWKFAGIPHALTFYRVNDSGLSANLDKQLASWQRAMDANRRGHEAFFKRYFSQARAYQLRYLARRAVQSNRPVIALKLAHQAIFTKWQIIVQEPQRTLLTLGCAYLSFLPAGVYQRLQQWCMPLVGHWQRAKLTEAVSD